ncbi:MAG: hypothetical protein WStaPseu_36120 [Shewanella algae]
MPYALSVKYNTLPGDIFIINKYAPITRGINRMGIDAAINSSLIASIFRFIPFAKYSGSDLSLRCSRSDFDLTVPHFP